MLFRSSGYDFPSSVHIGQEDNDCPVIGDGIPDQDSFSQREVKALVLERSLVPEDAVIYSTSTIRRTPGCSDPICEYPTDTFPLRVMHMMSSYNSLQLPLAVHIPHQTAAFKVRTSTTTLPRHVHRGL